MSDVAYLELVGVTRQFGRVRAVDDISARLPSSGIVALVGPNGAGKSTLLDILSGALRASAGKVKFTGMGATHSTTSGQRPFSRLHQRLVVPGDLTTAEYLCLAREPVGQLCGQRMLLRSWCQQADSQERYPEWAWNLLSAVDVVRELDAPIGNLSFGQQRVVALVAVLFAPGRCGCLLDEPFAGLAEGARIAARAAIYHYARPRLAILAEHDLDSVREIADVMLVLVGGQLVATYAGRHVRDADLLPHFLGKAT